MCMSEIGCVYVCICVRSVCVSEGVYVSCVCLYDGSCVRVCDRVCVWALPGAREYLTGLVSYLENTFSITFSQEL